MSRDNFESDDYYEPAICKTKLPKVSESSSNALLSAAASACVDIYMDIHVSEMRGKPEYLKKAWSVGREIYAAKNKGR